MKRALVGVLGVTLAATSVASADPGVPLVPFTLKMDTTTPVSWFRIQDLDVVVLGKTTRIDGELSAALGSGVSPVARSWNCVAVGGFAERHQCKMGKTDTGWSMVSIRLGHDNLSGPLPMSMYHSTDVPGDPQNWSSFALNVPATARGATALAMPAPVVQPKRLRYFSSVSGDLADAARKPLAQADIRQHVTQLKARGCDWVVFEWDGPGSTSDRDLATALPAFQGQNLHVVPAIRCPESRADLAGWARTLATGHGRHPAVARVNGKPVVFFAHQTAKRYSETMWDMFFAAHTDAQAQSFNVVEGHNPALLKHFDGLYWNPTTPEGTVGLRNYVGAYVHARFLKKAFVGRQIAPSARLVRPGGTCPVGAMQPTWVIGDVQRAQGSDPCACAAAAAPAEAGTPVPYLPYTFTVAGYAHLASLSSPALRKLWSSRGLGRHAWHKTHRTHVALTKPKRHKLFSSKRTGAHSWRDRKSREDALLLRHLDSVLVRPAPTPPPAPRKEHSSKRHSTHVWRSSSVTRVGSTMSKTGRYKAPVQRFNSRPARATRGRPWRGVRR